MNFSWTDFIAVLALVVSAISILLNFRLNKKTLFINTVTAERVKWLDKLRKNISSFCGLSYHWALTENKLDPKKRQEILEELDKLRWEIRLQLNPFNPKEKEIYEKIIEHLEKIPDLANPQQIAKLKDSINSLISVSQKLLKNEWEKVKDEAEKGRLKN